MRTFEEDVLCCDRCGARLRVMAFITAAETTRKVLEHLGLPHEPPRVAPARDPPEQLLPGFEDGAVAQEPVDPVPAGDGPEGRQRDGALARRWARLGRPAYPGALLRTS